MQFDLLCKLDDRLERLPFFLGKDFTPLVIFPFEDEDIYFELEETPATVRKNAEESCLPEHDCCNKVYPLKK